jgi:ABC-type transporter Mla MlaB component
VTTARAVGVWEQTTSGIMRFVAVGSLDIAVRDELARALRSRPVATATVAEIDMGSVTFLDTGSARLLVRFCTAAADAGGAVRVVNAGRLQLHVLTLVAQLEAGVEPGGDEPGGGWDDPSGPGGSFTVPVRAGRR